MIIGSIDIGSNTVLLLIAEIIDKKLIPILNEYMSPRLGKGLKENGKILDDRVNHLLDILREYKKICESHNCERIIISATNAMRIASNSKDIIDIVRAKLGLEIKVISGAEEAKLSYLGASSTFKEFPKKIVIDIGGGSTEIIYGEQSNIKFKNSFKVGVVSLTESFLNEFPHPQKNILSLQNHLDRIFESLTNTIPNSVPIIAVAGTPTTLSCIKQNIKVYDDLKVEGSTINKNDLKKLYFELVSIPGKEIRRRYGQVVEGREDVLFSGLLILDYLRLVLKEDLIYVSSRGLRYGNIINYMHQLK